MIDEPIIISNVLSLIEKVFLYKIMYPNKERFEGKAQAVIGETKELQALKEYVKINIVIQNIDKINIKEIIFI